MPSQSTDSVRVGPLALYPDDIKDLWEESHRLSRLPMEGSALSRGTSKISVEFRTVSGSARTLEFEDAEELLGSTEVPDQVITLRIRHYVQFRSELPDSEISSRTLEFSTGGRYLASRFQISGEADWVRGVMPALSPIVERHRREVSMRRIGVTFGFTGPLTAAIAFVGYKLAVWGIGIGVVVAYFTGFAVLFYGSFKLSEKANEWLPTDRIAVRGEPADPQFLDKIWQWITGTVTGVLLGIILGYFGVPH